MLSLKYKHVAIDFDGTISNEDNWPIIGEPLYLAKETMQKIIKFGGQISIWTCRSGIDLTNAINWLKENEIPYTYINTDFPMSSQFEGFTRKLWADIYIDNKDIHCIANGGIDWLIIDKVLFEEDWS